MHRKLHGYGLRRGLLPSVMNGRGEGSEPSSVDAMTMIDLWLIHVVVVVVELEEIGNDFACGALMNNCGTFIENGCDVRCGI